MKEWIFGFLLLTISSFYSVALQAAALTGSGNREELQQNLSVGNSEKLRSFFIIFDQPWSTDGTNKLLLDYNLTPLEARGVIEYKGETITHLMRDFSSYNGTFKDVVRYRNVLSNLNRQRTINSGLEARKPYLKLNEKVFDVFPEAVEEYWARVKVMGSYDAINRLVGSDCECAIIFSEKNEAPRIQEFLNKTRDQRKDVRDLDVNKIIDSKSKSLIDDTLTIGGQTHTELKSISISSQNNSPRNTMPLIDLGNTILCGPGGLEDNCPPDGMWLPTFTNFFARLSSSTGEGDTWGGIARVEFHWPGFARPEVPPPAVSLWAFQKTGLNPCHPVVSGEQALCGGGTEGNVVYVPDSTFEVEMDLANPTCLLRTGNDFVDRSAGCIVSPDLFSNIPGFYRDTTLFDASNRFNLTAGSSAPENLVADAAYWSLAELVAIDLDVPAHVGRINVARGQIGHKFSPLCTLVPGAALCTFAVDTGANTFNYPWRAN